jgi:hypothetical protein
MTRKLHHLSLILICLTWTGSVALAETCEGLFKNTYIEQFLRVNPGSLQNEVRNPAARALLIQRLAKKLTKGSFNADVDGQAQSLAVDFREGSSSVQIRLGSAHLIASEPSPLTQTQLGPAAGARSGVAVQFQWLDGEKLVITNTIISGNESTYLGLQKRTVRVELDLSGGPITSFNVLETVSNRSDYRKDDSTYTIPSTVKILSRR